MPRTKPSVFVAALSDRGLAMVVFGAANEADLKARFANAALSRPGDAARDFRQARPPDDPSETGAEFALDLRFAALKVWQALREIPVGTTAT
jgi:O6-methylguanine-DNA--protein-cysteine methyltransferase